MRNTRNKTAVGALKAAVIDLAAYVNQTPLSGRLLQNTKLPLDASLLRVAGYILQYEPIGVMELAQRVGRDHTTVSRHVTKLEGFGLVEKRESAADKRISEVVLTSKGRATAQLLLAAQDKLIAESLASWSDKDLDDLIRLMRRFIKDLRSFEGSPSER